MQGASHYYNKSTYITYFTFFFPQLIEIVNEKNDDSDRPIFLLIAIYHFSKL